MKLFCETVIQLQYSLVFAFHTEKSQDHCFGNVAIGLPKIAKNRPCTCRVMVIFLCAQSCHKVILIVVVRF